MSGMIECSQMSRPKKSLGLPTKPKKSLDQILTPQKIPCLGLLNNSKTRLFVLYSQNYAARALPILFNTPPPPPKKKKKKKSLLKSSCPKKYIHANFRSQKVPESNISNPQKSFDHPCHLNSRAYPPPPGTMSTLFLKGPWYSTYVTTYVSACCFSDRTKPDSKVLS